MMGRGALPMTAMLYDLFQVPELDDFPGGFARRAAHVVEELKRRWKETCADAAEKRKVPDLHATRGEYQALLKGHLRLLEDYLRVAELHRDAFGSSPGRVEEMRRAADELRDFYDDLFPHWQTLDDLYAITIAMFSPSAERARLLAAKYPPPQSWLDETDDPFSSD
jgi:hypothetical protein